MKNYEMEMIKDYIYERDVLDEEEFKRFFFEMFPNRSERYFNYYLMDFYRNNILYKYETKKLKPCRHRKVFNLELDIEAKLKYSLENISPRILISIWNTSSFSHFTSLQMFSNITIVETYSYAKEYVLNLLLEQGQFACYEEDYSIMSKYSRKAQLYVVRTLFEECPIVRKSLSLTGRTTSRDDKSTFLTVPKIEKLLVDFLVDEIYKILFSAEIDRIFYQLLKGYQINITTVLRYAKKRHFEQKILDYFDYIGFDVESGEFR